MQQVCRNLLFGLAPFAVFTVLTQLSVSLALWAAFALAFSLSTRAFVETRGLRLFDTAGLVLFGVMALLTGFAVPGLPIATVRLLAEGGYLFVVLLSLIRRAPFTLAYAEGGPPPEMAGLPLFLRANYGLTLAWALAFAAMAAADAAASFIATVPLSEPTALGLVTLAAALTFTWRLPAYISRRAAKHRR